MGGVSRSYLQSEGTESVPRLCPTYFLEISRWGSGGTWYGDSATGVGDWSRIGGSTPSELAFVLATLHILGGHIL